MVETRGTSLTEENEEVGQIKRVKSNCGYLFQPSRLALLKVKTHLNISF